MSDHDAPTSDLTAAYGELQNLLIASNAVEDFLHDLAVLAAGVIAPTAACGITLRRDHQLVTAAASSELASQVDEIQYGRGDGPCLQALRTGKVVTVPDLSVDDRWGDYRLHAIAHGVAGSLSLPLVVGETTVGALNLYTTEKHEFTPNEVTRVTAFAGQVSGAISIVLRQANQVELEGQLREALSSRTIIDQALGLVMGERRCTARDAFGVLREASQNRNVKLQIIAAELIETMTGYPAEVPRPFVQRPAG